MREITKAQAAALCRGRLLPFRGNRITLPAGLAVSQSPDGKYYLHNSEPAGMGDIMRENTGETDDAPAGRFHNVTDTAGEGGQL